MEENVGFEEFLALNCYIKEEKLKGNIVLKDEKLEENNILVGDSLFKEEEVEIDDILKLYTAGKEKRNFVSRKNN